MRFLCFITTVVSLALAMILFCGDTSFVVAAKQGKGSEERYKLCDLTPSGIDELLSNNCVNRRKREGRQSDENILQSPEQAQRFLEKRNNKYVTNYVLFMEECCFNGIGCRVEEILEHCVAS